MSGVDGSARPGSRCLVVGAGIVGSCCAWHLARAGLDVTLLDRELPGQSTSFGNAACISPSHVAPFSYPGVWKRIPGWLLDRLGPLTIRWRHLPWVAPWLWRFWRTGTEQGVLSAAEAQAQLMRRVADDYDELLGEAGLSDYLRARGLIVVYDRPEDFEQDRWSYELERDMGFPSRQLDREEAQELAPALRIGEGPTLFVPSWRHTVDPARMTADIAGNARRRGARWLREEVREVTAGAEDRPGGIHVTLAEAGTIETDWLVIAAGAWSNRLAERLDHPVPLAPKRGYHATISDPGVALDIPVMSGSRTFVMTPLDCGLRLAGTAEFARLDAPPDHRRARILLEHARHYFPDLRPRGVSEWMGQRPMMADSVPVISRSPSRPRVIYAFGHGHYGLTQGPTTGRLVADLVTRQGPVVDLAPYRFERFAEDSRPGGAVR